MHVTTVFLAAHLQSNTHSRGNTRIRVLNHARLFHSCTSVFLNYVRVLKPLYRRHPSPLVTIVMHV